MLVNGDSLTHVARPVESHDDELLDAAAQVLMTEGPATFTLAKAAAAAGVSAATLVKRFDSKDGLFLRLSQRWVATLDVLLSDSAAAHATPLARLRAVALHGYYDLDHPATAANQLAALAVDLQNDDLRQLLHRGWGARVRTWRGTRLTPSPPVSSRDARHPNSSPASSSPRWRAAACPGRSIPKAHWLPASVPTWTHCSTPGPLERRSRHDD